MQPAGNLLDAVEWADCLGLMQRLIVHEYEFVLLPRLRFAAFLPESVSTWQSDYEIMADPILAEATGCASQPQFLCLKEGQLGGLWVISGHDDC